MTHVHYKFSSKLSYDTVLFDGPHITLRDLKRQIMGRERLRAGDCDLQITNAQSKEEYTDDEGLIPKGSSVIVRRIPVCGGKSSSNTKTKNTQSSAVSFHHTYGAAKAMDEQSSSRALPFLAKMANLAEADVSEEDKIRVMLSQSTYDAMNYNKRFGAVLPPNYTCYRCGNTGHHIRSCPTSGQDKTFEAPLRIRKSTGIPRSFMVEVDDPNMKGAMLTNTGHYAIPAIDAEAYAIGKKEKPPFIPQEKPSLEAAEDPVPDELLCLICCDLLSDAVVIPCCGNSYCDDCIRTTLLDSEEHVCPTCSQSDVSPDTLIANKFLRQAVNNFKKERGYTTTLKRRCGASQSQNLTTRSSPVATPPPLTGQSQPQKPQQPTSSQQPRVADPLPLSEAPPAATGLASACSTPGTSIQSEKTGLEIHDQKPEEKTRDDSAPSALASNKELSPAPSRQIPVVNHTAAAEQPEPICVKQQQQSSSAPSPCGPPTSWDSSSSSSAHPSRGWTETQQLNSCSSSYSATTPSLFPSPIFLSPHQPHPSFPPGYQPTTPLWPVPSPHGTPIPSLCSSMSTSSIPSLSSSTSTSFIPSLIPDEWYRHQRKKNERGTSYRLPTSRSKSYKSKSSRSYSNSSSRSRSRSRSRSKSRSRHQSPYSHHRNLHTRSHAFSSYGYKCSRSPTPSSSSSPRVSHSSRSKSPSDHQKKRHHGRHQSKKSSSSRYSSRRRGERPVRETGSSEAGLASPLSAPHRSQSSSLDLERERYLQWKKDYKEWCEKYFSSYVGHFHQLPLPLLNLPPPPPQWEDTTRAENNSRAKPDSDYQPQGGCPTPRDGHSPSLRSSSASRSPPSHSSSDSRSTPSQSFSDSGSSPSHSSSNSRSPPLQSFSDSLATPSADRAQMGLSPIPKGTEEVNLQNISKGDKKVNVKNLEGLGSLKHDRRRPKSRKEGREGKSVSLTRDTKYDEWLREPGPNVCKDTGFPAQDKETISGAVKSVQPCPKSNRYLDEHHERESREKRWRTGKHSDTRRDEDRRRKAKHSRERDRRGADQYRSRERGKSAGTKSTKSRRRKGEEAERNEAQRKSVSPKLTERNKTNNDKKDPKKQESQIWEEGMKVAPQKRKIINININLDGKRKEFDSQSVAEKTNEENERTGNEEKGEGEPRKEDVAETSKTWDKGTFREVKMWETFAVEGKEVGEKKQKRTGEGFDLWPCALRGGVEEEDGGRHRSKASKEEAVTRDEEMNKTGNQSHSQEIADLIQNTQKEEPDGKDMLNTNRETALGELNTNTKRELTTVMKQGDDPMMSEEQRGQLERPEAAAGDGSICEDRRERRKTLEDNTRETDPEREDVPVKVPLSRWDKGSEEAEQDKSERIAQDALPVPVPPSLVVAAKQETEEKRWRSVDTERDGNQQMPRRRLHNDASGPGINRAVAPSSGTYTTMCTDGERDRKMELERYRDRETGREGERSQRRQKESKRPKDKRREEERGRYHNKRDPPASGSSSSTSRDTERRDWQRGGGQGSERKSLHPKDRSSLSTAVEMPDKNAYKAQSHVLAHSKSKARIHPRNFPDQPDSSCNYTHVPSNAQGRDGDPLSSKSFSPTPRASSQEEGGEWKQSKATKGNRETGEKEADGEGGRRWGGISSNNIWVGESMWHQRREMQEEEGSSSRSSYSCSSASLEEEIKKHRQERRAAVPEHLEEHELHRRKKSKSGAEVEGGGNDRMVAPGFPEFHG